jgi:hypothetical protein
MTSLDDISTINEWIKKATLQTVKVFHKLIFEEEGDRYRRSRLREFVGFDYEPASDEFTSKTTWIANNLTRGDLTAICSILCINYEGTLEEVAKRICSHLCDLNSLVPDAEACEDDDEDIEEDCATHSRPSTPPRDDVQVPVARSKFTMTFRDIQDTVRQFTGEDNYPVEVWIRDFEEIAKMMEWSDIEKLVCARRCMSGLAKLFIQSERGLSTWIKLKEALLDEFLEKITSAELYKRLSQRKIKKDETIQQYFFAMKELASRGGRLLIDTLCCRWNSRLSEQ